MAFFKVALNVTPREHSLAKVLSPVALRERSWTKVLSHVALRERSLANVLFANIPLRMFPHERSLDCREL